MQLWSGRSTGQHGTLRRRSRSADPATTDFTSSILLHLTTTGPVRPGYATLQVFESGLTTPNISLSINGVPTSLSLPFMNVTTPFTLGTDFTILVEYALSGSSASAVNGGAQFNLTFFLQDTVLVGDFIPTPGERVQMLEVAAVPEPSSILLSVVGLARNCAARRNRRRPLVEMS